MALNFKRGDILIDRYCNTFLLLTDLKMDKYHGENHGNKYTIDIPYAEIEVLFKPLYPDMKLTRLIGGDFKRLEKVTYKEAERRYATATILYSKA